MRSDELTRPITTMTNTHAFKIVCATDDCVTGRPGDPPRDDRGGASGRRPRSRRRRARSPSRLRHNAFVNRWCSKPRLQTVRRNWTSPLLRSDPAQRIPAGDSLGPWKPCAAPAVRRPLVAADQKSNPGYPGGHAGRLASTIHFENRHRNTNSADDCWHTRPARCRRRARHETASRSEDSRDTCRIFDSSNCRRLPESGSMGSWNQPLSEHRPVRSSNWTGTR